MLSSFSFVIGAFRVNGMIGLFNRLIVRNRSTSICTRVDSNSQFIIPEHASSILRCFSVMIEWRRARIIDQNLTIWRPDLSKHHS